MKNKGKRKRERAKNCKHPQFFLLLLFTPLNKEFIFTFYVSVSRYFSFDFIPFEEKEKQEEKKYKKKIQEKGRKLAQEKQPRWDDTLF